LSGLVPTADEPSHVACEAESDGSAQDLLSLKETFVANHKDIQVKPEHSISLRHYRESDHPYKHPKTPLMHARLDEFTTRHGLEQLQNISLQKF
jgi:hypothetical protein